MEIIFLRANKTKFGGAENYLSRLASELSRQDIDYKIINSIFPKFLPSWLRVVLFNLQACLAKQDNIYFSLERITCSDIYRAGDGVHKVFLTTIQKSKFNPLHPIYLYLEKKCFQNSKYIIANSQMIKKQIIREYGINSHKIKVIYNGINLNNNSNPKNISQEFDLKNEKILLFVGSGFERKGVVNFLKIVANLKTQNIKAFVVGNDKNINFYKNLAKELDLINKVIFTNTREDVNDFYALSDIFIFPTHYEPFSNVVLEAMSFNNVIFTTKQNGASEILENDFIMQNSFDNISARIDDLLKSTVKLQRIKDDNYRKVQQFSIENNVKQTLQIISNL